MLQFHIRTHQADLAQAPQLDAAECNHSDWVSTDGDTLRCCRCLSQLVMLPHKPGEFRLEWVSSSGDAR